MVRRQRLVLVDIQGRRGQPSILESGSQCFFVHDSAACGVHEDGVWLESSDAFRIEELLRLGRQRHVKGKEIHDRQHVVQLH